jgi:hypothetical protein
VADRFIVPSPDETGAAAAVNGIMIRTLARTKEMRNNRYFIVIIPGFCVMH